MSFKHTRRATSRTERRPDGSEIVERSEEESYEEEDTPRDPSPRRRRSLGGPGFSSVRRMFGRISAMVGLVLLPNRVKEFFNWLSDNVVGSI